VQKTAAVGASLLRFHLGDHQDLCIIAAMKHRFPDPRDVAARKALAAMPPAPLERVLRQAEASRRWTSDQLRESRSKHTLDTHEEAIAQMRRFRAAMDESAARSTPSSSADYTASP
jgi:hypothetical protein